MKALKIISGLILTLTLFSSCIVSSDDYHYDNPITLEQLVNSYDLWYVDYNKTTGAGEVPFLSKAFTISFLEGHLYANNNMVGLGAIGNGYGLQIGYYETYNGVLEIEHSLDGFIDLEVIKISNNEIRITDTYTNTSYYLIGHQRSNFDYDLDRLCPNCARQGQTFPNSSKRNQKLVEKVK